MEVQRLKRQINLLSCKFCCVVYCILIQMIQSDQYFKLLKDLINPLTKIFRLGLICVALFTYIYFNTKESSNTSSCSAQYTDKLLINLLTIKVAIFQINNLQNDLQDLVMQQPSRLRIRSRATSQGILTLNLQILKKIHLNTFNLHFRLVFMKMTFMCYNILWIH